MPCSEVCADGFGQDLYPHWGIIGCDLPHRLIEAARGVGSAALA
jgi:hypothetical protein